MKYKRTVKIEVTQEIIDESRRVLVAGGSRAYSCPIAMAIQLQVPAGRRVSVGSLYHIWGHDSVSEYSGELPEVACNFRNRFDDGQDVSPVSFDLDLPRYIPILYRRSTVDSSGMS